MRFRDDEQQLRYSSSKKDRFYEILRYIGENRKFIVVLKPHQNGNCTISHHTICLGCPCICVLVPEIPTKRTFCWCQCSAANYRGGTIMQMMQVSEKRSEDPRREKKTNSLTQSECLAYAILYARIFCNRVSMINGVNFSQPD